MDRENSDNEQLEALTIRFTKDAMAVLEHLSEMNQISKAEIVRYCVDDRLEKHLSSVYVLDINEARRIREEVCKLSTVLQQIRLELNKIGVNYNQQVKQTNIQHKYNEKSSVNENTNRDILLLTDSVNELMNRFENETQKVGDVLWHILV